MCIHQCQKATLLLLFRFHGLLLPCLALCTFVSPGVRVSPCVRLCVPVLGRVCARVLLSLRVRVRPRMSRVPVGAPVSVPARSARVRDTPRRCPCPWRARPLAPPRGGTQPALLGAGAGRGGVSAARPRGSRAAAPAVLSPRADAAPAASRSCWAGGASSRFQNDALSPPPLAAASLRTALLGRSALARTRGPTAPAQSGCARAAAARG